MNEVAKETIEIGLSNPPDGVNVASQEWIESDSMDKNKLMEEFCTKYDTMVDNQTPPDLGPDHVQVNWKHKSIVNISQFEIRPLIG